MQPWNHDFFPVTLLTIQWACRRRRRGLQWCWQVIGTETRSDGGSMFLQVSFNVSGAAGGRSEPTVTGSCFWVRRRAGVASSVRGAGGRWRGWRRGEERGREGWTEDWHHLQAESLPPTERHWEEERQAGSIRYNHHLTFIFSYLHLWKTIQAAGKHTEFWLSCLWVALTRFSKHGDPHLTV